MTSSMQTTSRKGTDVTTRATAIELLIRLSDMDLDQVAALHADWVDWHLDWPSGLPVDDVPRARDVIRRADVVAHYRRIAAGHGGGGLSARVDRILVDGNAAVVTGTLVGLATRTARVSRAFALHLTVEEGLVTRHHLVASGCSAARGWMW
jgi:hypothetical protein